MTGTSLAQQNAGTALRLHRANSSIFLLKRPCALLAADQVPSLHTLPVFLHLPALDYFDTPENRPAELLLANGLLLSSDIATLADMAPKFAPDLEPHDKLLFKAVAMDCTAAVERVWWDCMGGLNGADSAARDRAGLLLLSAVLRDTVGRNHPGWDEVRRRLGQRFSATWGIKYASLHDHVSGLTLVELEGQAMTAAQACGQLVPRDELASHDLESYEASVLSLLNYARSQGLVGGLQPQCLTLGGDQPPVSEQAPPGEEAPS